jgi:hypothetical protein
MAEFDSVASYMWFEEEARTERRHFYSKHTEDFFKAVLATGANRVLNLAKDTSLWRAQRGHAWRTVKYPDLTLQLTTPYPQSE